MCGWKKVWEPRRHLDNGIVHVGQNGEPALHFDRKALGIRERLPPDVVKFLRQLIYFLPRVFSQVRKSIGRILQLLICAETQGDSVTR